MTISINIHCDTAEDARAEMRMLLGEDVRHSGPVQGDLYQGETSGSWASGSKTQQQNLPRGDAEAHKNQTTGEADPLQSLLDGKVKDIKAELPNLLPGELTRLDELEQAGKDRATLLKAIMDEIDSRDSGDEPAGEDAAGTPDPTATKANTGLDDDEQGDTAPDPTPPKTEPEGPSLEDCREIGRQVQRLDGGTEMLRELLATLGTEKLSTAHEEGKGAAFIAGCEKILAAQENE